MLDCQVQITFTLRKIQYNGEGPWRELHEFCCYWTAKWNDPRSIKSLYNIIVHFSDQYFWHMVCFYSIQSICCIFRLKQDMPLILWSMFFLVRCPDLYLMSMEGHYFVPHSWKSVSNQSCYLKTKFWSDIEDAKLDFVC